MKRTATIVLLGLAAGLSAHLAWFQLRRPASPERLGEQLAWMQARLELSADQFAHIRDLHEELQPKLTQLAAEVERMRTELAAFERERVTRGQIDFLAFARLVQEQRSVDQACLESTRELVGGTLGVMTPQQRERYLSILGPAGTGPTSSAFH
jgi:hypothetical protein